MKKTLFGILFTCITFNAKASDLNIPNIFIANQPAIAAEVNGNFTAVEGAVDDNNARIASLEATIASLQSTVNSLNSRLVAVENNTVLELDGLLGYSELNGYPTAEFSAVNVQVNSGSGVTSATPNGLGNFIVGYNEPSATSPEFCSNFQYLDRVLCIGNGFLWGRNVYRGSHNIVMGSGNSYDNFSAIVNGFDNVANGDYSSVISGSINIANSHYSSITGGFENRTSLSNYASISGGRGGVAFGHSSSISGGYWGEAGGSNSSVSGGWANSALDTSSSVSGGRSNFATGRFSSISGGNTRTASGDYDWVAGSLFEDN
jgi:hypothetical protein